MIFADQTTGDCIEGASSPQGRFTVPLSDASAYRAWYEANKASFQKPPPAAPVYSREDYKAALDAMLKAACQSYEFDGLETLTLYLWGEPSKFQTRAQWCARLNIFTWETSDNMAAQPPAGDPPTPEQFAQYILGLFEASNPRPV